MSNEPGLILFDYGGVLLDFHDTVEVFGSVGQRDDFFDRWGRSPAVRAHETGRIGPREFARRLVAEFGLPFSPRDFLDRFAAWPDRVPASTVSLVQAIPARIDCAILSNTNALHWRMQDVARDFGGRIGRLFLSFETGFMKPDAAAFRHVLEETGRAAGDVLFIDDSRRNVEAARREGLRARHCPDVRALARVLQDAAVVGDIEAGSSPAPHR